MDSNNKILLIHPPQVSQKGVFYYMRYPPLGILALAAALREHGFKPYVIDAYLEEKNAEHRIFSLIQEYQINIIGLSFTTILAEGAYLLAAKIKKRFPVVTIIAGGYHATVMPDEVINKQYIDYVVSGEGELTLALLIKAICQNKAVESVDGIYYKKSGQVFHTSPRALIHDIDKLPIPAYDLLDFQNYRSLSNIRKPFVTMIRSRGCPFKCIFCGVDAIFSKKYRCQSPQRTIDEILYLVERFGVREILFKDSEFLINRKNVEEFCHLLMDKRLDLVWSCGARVDRIDKELAALMKQAGCRQITFGIESGSQKMLNALQKDFTVEQIVNAVYAAKEQGILCVGGFIIGAPGEDQKTLSETVNLIKKLDLDYASFQFLTAFPGSRLYEMAHENNWFITDSRFLGYERANINASKMSEDELKSAMRKMVRLFYFRFSYLCKRLVKTTSRDISNNLVCGGRLLKKLVCG